MPTMDEGGFVLDYVAPPGTSLTETDRLMRQIEAILAATPEVATYSRRTGAQLGGGLTEPNTGDFFIRLKPQPRRDIDEVMGDVREQVQAQVPGVDIETAQLMEDLIGDLTAVPEPIEVKLYSRGCAAAGRGRQGRRRQARQGRRSHRGPRRRGGRGRRDRHPASIWRGAALAGVDPGGCGQPGDGDDRRRCRHPGAVGRDPVGRPRLDSAGAAGHGWRASAPCRSKPPTATSSPSRKSPTSASCAARPSSRARTRGGWWR